MSAVEDAGDAVARPKPGNRPKLDIQPEPGTRPKPARHHGFDRIVGIAPRPVWITAAV
jgi:hypothetical protein